MKNVTIYFEEGTLDCYTFITKNDHAYSWSKDIYNCLTTCLTGNSVFQHSIAKVGKHLGKKVKFESLHPDLQTKIKNYYAK